MGVRPDAERRSTREDPGGEPPRVGDKLIFGGRIVRVSPRAWVSRRRGRARAPFALRARVRWDVGGLDRRLAEGTPPSRSRALSLRAAQLTNREQQVRMATELDWTVNQARSRHGDARLVVPLQRAAIDAGADDLRALANALRFSARRVPRAAAIASYLLHDGCSPFYNPHATTSPGALARGAAAALWPSGPDASSAGYPGSPDPVVGAQSELLPPLRPARRRRPR